MPLVSVSVYSPTNGRSVPAWRSTAYSSAESCSRHSSSVFSTWCSMSPRIPARTRVREGRHTWWRNCNSVLQFRDEGVSRMASARQLTRKVPWERVRRAGTRLTTPLHPDDYLSRVNPLWSSRELRGRIEQVIPETDDAATVVIRPGWGWRWDHRPG